MSSRFLPNQLARGLDKAWFLMAERWLGQGACRKGYRGPGWAWLPLPVATSYLLQTIYRQCTAWLGELDLSILQE